MSVHFVDKIKKMIAQENLPNLSDDGWKRMRNIERHLDESDLESAIGAFLAEREGKYAEILSKKYKMQDHLKFFQK